VTDNSPNIFSVDDNNIININLMKNKVLNKEYLDEIYNSIFNDILYGKNNNLTNYHIQRIYLYLNVFNIILNTAEPEILHVLLLNMHKYNLILYNVSIQYGISNIQNERVIEVNDINTLFLSNNNYYREILIDICKKIDYNTSTHNPIEDYDKLYYYSRYFDDIIKGKDKYLIKDFINAYSTKSFNTSNITQYIDNIISNITQTINNITIVNELDSNINNDDKLKQIYNNIQNNKQLIAIYILAKKSQLIINVTYNLIRDKSKNENEDIIANINILINNIYIIVAIYLLNQDIIINLVNIKNKYLSDVSSYDNNIITIYNNNYNVIKLNSNNNDTSILYYLEILAIIYRLYNITSVVTITPNVIAGAGTSAGTGAGTGAGTSAGTSAGTGAGTSAGTSAGTGAGTGAGTSAINYNTSEIKYLTSVIFNNDIKTNLINNCSKDDIRILIGIYENEDMNHIIDKIISDNSYNITDVWINNFEKLSTLITKIVVSKIIVIKNDITEIYNKTKYLISNFISEVNSTNLPNIQIPPITNKIVIDIIEIISLQQYTDAIYFSDLDKSQYTTNKINSYSGSLILPTSITISINTNIKLDIENIIILPDTARIDNLGTIQNNLNNKINNLYKYKSNNDPVNVTNITKYIEKLYENIEYVRSNYLVINKDLKIYYDATINTAIIKEFYSKQEKLNKLINLYNKELQIYNKEVKYNNTLIIIGVIILIIIYLVPNKYKIIITAIIIISLIILLLNFSNNKETFMVLKKYQSDNDNIILNLSDNINLIKYKTARDEYILMLNDYIYNLYLISSNNDVSNSLKPMIMYKNKLHKAKTEKIEYYKLRYTDLINSIEIVKKSSNNYNNLVKVYYIILIVILICLILSILEINYKQIILIFIITLIVIIYIFSYKMHKITRMIENKYYWSNFNPYFI
jgi:hypothetical protein